MDAKARETHAPLKQLLFRANTSRFVSSDRVDGIFASLSSSGQCGPNGEQVDRCIQMNANTSKKWLWIELLPLDNTNINFFHGRTQWNAHPRLAIIINHITSAAVPDRRIQKAAKTKETTTTNHWAGCWTKLRTSDSWAPRTPCAAVLAKTRRDQLR